MNEPGGARSRRAHFPQLKRLGKLAAAGARLSSRSAAQSMGRFEDAQLARQRHACRRESSRSFAVSSREATTAGRQAAFPTRLKNPRRGMWTRSGRFWTRGTSSGASRPGGRLLWRLRGGSSGSPLGLSPSRSCAPTHQSCRRLRPRAQATLPASAVRHLCAGPSHLPQPAPLYPDVPMVARGDPLDAPSADAAAAAPTDTRLCSQSALTA